MTSKFKIIQKNKKRFTVMQISDWISYLIAPYKTRVQVNGGSIINETILKSEFNYVKQNNLKDKIAYWISRDFGFKAGTEINPESFVVISHDDAGLINTYNSYVAKGTGRGTHFINSKFIGDPGYATWAEIATQVAGNMDIECHTWSHANGSNLTLIPLTDIPAEFINLNTDFVTHGMPIPIHMALPQNITDFDTITPIIAQYRKTMRGGTPYGSNSTYYALCWWSYIGESSNFNNVAGRDAAIIYIDSLLYLKCPIILAGHTTTAAFFEAVLDHIITTLGLEVCTTSELYARVNTFRDKWFNVFERNYETLVYLDSGTKLDSENGLIVFDDSLANIGTTIANRYVSKGYKVAFWDDETAAAFEYAISNNIKYYDETPVTVDPATDRLSIANHKFYTLTAYFPIVLSGTTAPGNLTFGTTYYVRDRRLVPNWDFKLSPTAGGVAIDITDAGVNVKLSILEGFRDVLKTKTLGGVIMNSFKKMVTTNGVGAILDMSKKGFGGTLNDCNLSYIRNQSSLSIILTDNMIGGDIPENIINCSRLTKIYLNNNLITGGLEHLGKIISLTNIELTNNLIVDTIPISYGNLVKLSTLYLSINQITGVIPVELGNLILITRFRFANNQLSGYEAGAISIGMTVLIEVDFSYNAIISATDINQILADCLALHLISAVNITISLNGGTNAAPTGQGIVDKAALIAHGCPTTTN